MSPVARRNDVIDAAGAGLAVQLLEAPTTPEGGVHLPRAIAQLRELGYRRILCEGGPRLFASAVAADVVDELCLTVSPRLVGPDGPRISAGVSWGDGVLKPLRLIGLLTEDDALFCRYHLR
jgi:riboflavin biosynthesis pyrimidine reductase